MLPRAIVVIPVSKEPLTWFDKISLKQVHKVLHKYTICFIVPDKSEISWLQDYPDDRSEVFDESFFGSAYAHNRLLLTKEFYQRFIDYDYILLYHLDAFVFYDALHEYMSLGYDYIASPHLEKKIVIGGKTIYDGIFGGFALRSPKAFIKALENHSENLKEWFGQEDCFFCWCAQEYSTIKKAPRGVAIGFSHETSVRKMYKRNNNRLPMGAHAWWKRDFAFYRTFIEQEGYFLPPELECMVKEPLDFKIRKAKVEDYLFRRLFRLEDNKRMIKKYIEDNFGVSRKYAIWGAGLDGYRFYACIQNVCDIVMYLDNDEDKWGKRMGNLVISKPNFSHIRGQSFFVFVATKLHGTIIAEEMKKSQFEQGKDFIIVEDFQSKIISYLKGV